MYLRKQYLPIVPVPQTVLKSKVFGIYYIHQCSKTYKVKFNSIKIQSKKLKFFSVLDTFWLVLRTALLIVAKTSLYELHFAALQAPCLGSSIISLPSIRVSSSTITPTLTKCLLANKQNKLCTFSLAPVDNTPLNDFQNAYLALWK